MEALTAKMEHVDAQGFTDVAVVTNKESHQYFARKLDLKREWDSNDDDLPDADDTK